MDVSLDYGASTMKNLITPDEGAQAIVTNDCADGIPNDPRIGRDAGGQLLRTVNSLFINAGSVLLRHRPGGELRLPWRQLGQFGVSVSVTWLHKFDIQLDEDSPKIDGRGNRNFAIPISLHAGSGARTPP